MSEPITDIDEARRAVADAFELQIEAAVERMLRLFRDEIEEFAAIRQPEVWDSTRRLTYVSRRLQAAAIRAGRVPTEMSHDAQAARQGAVGGLSHDAILRSYQIAGGVAWQAFMLAAESVPVDPDLRMELFDVVSGLVRNYEERLLSEVSAASERALQEAGAAASRARVLGVRRVLDGYSDSDEALGYELDADHLAIIAWGEAAEGALSAAAEAIPHAGALVVEAVGGETLKLWWAWLSVTGHSDHERALRGLAVEEGAQLACGVIAPGVEGFRSSHRLAGYAYTVAERTGEPITDHREVALEGLILQNEEHAREIARLELGPLWGEDQLAVKLRRTLHAYFASGQNAASAAARLRVSEHTVARHLSRIAEEIGRPVQSRRAELELALRTHRLKELAEAKDQGLALVRD